MRVFEGDFSSKIPPKSIGSQNSFEINSLSFHINWVEKSIWVVEGHFFKLVGAPHLAPSATHSTVVDYQADDQRPEQVRAASFDNAYQMILW